MKMTQVKLILITTCLLCFMKVVLDIF